MQLLMLKQEKATKYRTGLLKCVAHVRVELKRVNEKDHSFLMKHLNLEFVDTSNAGNYLYLSKDSNITARYNPSEHIFTYCRF